MSESPNTSVSEDRIALRCENLHRYLGEGAGRVHVLKGVSLELMRGKIYAIVGPSGCGKSTLLYLLGLLDKPDEGEIFMGGEPMTTASDLGRTVARCAHLGFVFQFHFLLKEFSALENVMIPMRKLGTLSPLEMETKAKGYLESVGLGDKLGRLATQLSGGEQQRVAIARSLANTPSVILADEPTGNLDVANSNIVIELLTRLARENDQAILIVTHNTDVAKQCDHILAMEDGQFLR
jgi:lipoprotein-releasing system ATP-binding protein